MLAGDHANQPHPPRLNTPSHGQLNRPFPTPKMLIVMAAGQLDWSAVAFLLRGQGMVRLAFLDVSCSR